jgi:hypothetical protein
MIGLCVKLYYQIIPKTDTSKETCYQEINPFLCEEIRHPRNLILPKLLAYVRLRLLDQISANGN